MRFLFVVVSLLGLVACQPTPLKLAETTVHYSEPKALLPFAIQDQFGKTLTNEALQSHWTWLFLGYTSCPDICPMTLAKLAAAKKKLPNHKVQIWFVSVDPNRDTEEKREAYTAYFGEDIVGATAPHDVLFPFVRSLGLVYAIGDSNQAEYQVDHSASVALVNPKGELVAMFKPEFALGKVPLINQDNLTRDFIAISALY
ncbi:Cytochrome oxidase biogenesis protein Sco1/SenC/PrrC, putative copper metallochaperone [Pseudoalteromonas luteoviolacea B = ATCC 29581]|nr:Cytochrome oxidase biogenesis protein Sco1/SenC/PrrC, putative copper metallochaperone [Pseudoalteromonas luteoviolacea B = ATCC 29581]